MNSKFFFVFFAALLAFSGVWAAPSGVSLSIASGSQYTNSATPALTIAATDANWMKFSCDNSTWSSYEAFSTSKTNFDITSGNGCVAGDGDKTVYLEVKADDNSTAPASDGISLDSTKPATTVSGNSSSWSAIDLNLVFSCSDSASGCQKITVDGNDYSGSSANVAFSSDADKTIAFYSTDVAGNIEVQQSVSVKIDKTPPAGTISSNSYVNSIKPHFALSATDSTSGMSSGKMKFSCGTNYSSEVAYAADYSLFDITSGNDCNSAQGGKTIHAKFADAAGNWSSTDINVQIIYDTSVPNTPTISTAVPEDGKVTVNWSAVTDSGSGVKDYNVYKDGVLAATTSSLSTVIGGLTNGTSYSFEVSANDNAGNGSPKSAVVSVKPVAPSSSSSNSSNNSSSSSSSSDSGNSSSVSSTSSDNSFPTISFNGLDENQNLVGVQKIKVKAEDSSGIKSVELYVDSESAENLVGKTDAKTGDYYEFELDSSKWSVGAHNLIASAFDLSLNENKGSLKLLVKFNEKIVEPKTETVVEKTEKPLYSRQTVFGEKSTTSYNSIGLESEIQNAIDLLKKSKASRKIEILKEKDSSYKIIVSISFNAVDKNSLKLIEFVPKDFAKSASQIASDKKFNALIDDPVIEFDLDSLDSNNSIVQYWLGGLTKEQATSLAKSDMVSKFNSPPVFLPIDSKIDVEAIKQAISPQPVEKDSGQNSLFGLLSFNQIPGIFLIIGFIAAIAIVLSIFYGKRIFNGKKSIDSSANSPENSGNAFGDSANVIGNSANSAGNSIQLTNSSAQNSIDSRLQQIVAEGKEIEKPSRKTVKEKILELDSLEEKLKGLRRKEGS